MDARGHKLVLLDCCNAASAGIGISGRLEVLAASGFETIASSELQISFTKHMIDILKEAKGAAVNVSALCARMVDDALRTKLEATPWQGAATTQPPVTLKAVHSTRASRTYKIQAAGNGKVLISVSLAGKAKLPDYKEFVKWLSENIPSDVGSITVDGVFDANSTKYLLTVPIAVWLNLPEYDCFHFVAHVRSGNKLLTLNAAAVDAVEGTASLPLRRKENLPPGGFSRESGPGSSTGLVDSVYQEK